MGRKVQCGKDVPSHVGGLRGSHGRTGYAGKDVCQGAVFALSNLRRRTGERGSNDSLRWQTRPSALIVAE
jgi:hypothetical protein